MSVGWGIGVKECSHDDGGMTASSWRDRFGYTAVVEVLWIECD
jgi:hypothetical protein